MMICINTIIHSASAFSVIIRLWTCDEHIVPHENTWFLFTCFSVWFTFQIEHMPLKLLFIQQMEVSVLCTQIHIVIVTFTQQIIILNEILRTMFYHIPSLSLSLSLSADSQSVTSLSEIWLGHTTTIVWGISSQGLFGTWRTAKRFWV